MTGILFLAVINYFLIYRNYKTRKFLDEVLEMACDSSFRNIDRNLVDYDKPLRVYEKLSYIRLVFSFRPITLEAWLTDEDIRVLKIGK